MTSKKGRYGDFFKSGLYRKFLREERESSGRYKTHGILAHQDPHKTSDPSTSDLVIGLMVGGKTDSRWQVGGKWREIKGRQSGHIGISPTDEKIVFDVESPHELLIVSIDKKAIANIQKDYKEDCLDVLNSKGSLRYHRNTAVQANMCEIWYALGQQNSMSLLLVDALTESLIARLVNMVGGCEALSSADAASGKPAQKMPLQQIEAFVRAEMKNGVSVSAIAATCDMPASTFNRKFKQATGQSPYQFVQQVRLQMATAALLSKKQSISDIALQLGFSDQSHFTRFFREMMGVTPAMYQSS